MVSARSAGLVSCTMSRRVALLAHPDVDETGVPRVILSYNYVSELISGEDSADLSALTHMIAPQGHASTIDDAVRAVETNAACMLGADEDSEQDKCVCLVMLDAEQSVTKQARMPFSFVVDALQRLQAGHSLESYMFPELHPT